MELQTNGEDCEAPEAPWRVEASPDLPEPTAPTKGAAAAVKCRRSLIPTPSRIPGAPAGSVVRQQLQHKQHQHCSRTPAPAETWAGFRGPYGKSRPVAMRAAPGGGGVSPLATRHRITKAAAAGGALMDRNRPGGWLRFQDLFQTDVSRAKPAAAAAMGAKALNRPQTFKPGGSPSSLPFDQAADKVGAKAVGVQAVGLAAAQGALQSSGTKDENPAAGSSVQFSLSRPLFSLSSAAAGPKAVGVQAVGLAAAQGALQSSGTGTEDEKPGAAGSSVQFSLSRPLSPSLSSAAAEPKAVGVQAVELAAAQGAPAVLRHRHRR